MRILGISAFYHDSAAALVEDGRIVAAAQEERFSRRKHDAEFPVSAIDYCLSEIGGTLEDVDYIVFYDKPFLKFERLVETYLAFAPRGFTSFRQALPLWLKEKLFQKSLLKKELQRHAQNFDWHNRLLFAEHHQSHAASAFFPSPFDDAVVLTMDGVGEWATTSVAIGHGSKLESVREIHFPHSLGLLYSAFTYYTGFKVNSGEYKVMGLAPYGEPRYADRILEHVIDLKSDGTFRLDQSYFEYCTGLRMTNGKFRRAFRGSRAESQRTSNPASYGSRCIRPGGNGRSCFAPDPGTRKGNGDQQPLPGGGCRPQLRGQWQGPARQRVRQYLDSTRGRGCRWCTRRCVGGLLRSFGKRPSCQQRAGRDGWQFPGSILHPGRDSA